MMKKIVPVHGFKLRRVINSLRGQDILIAIDANAQSPLWHCLTAYDKG